MAKTEVQIDLNPMAKCPCCQDMSALSMELQNEIHDLRRENYDLKYRLYWKDHNTTKLQRAMLESNIWLMNCSVTASIASLQATGMVITLTLCHWNAVSGGGCEKSSLAVT